MVLSSVLNTINTYPKTLLCLHCFSLCCQLMAGADEGGGWIRHTQAKSTSRWAKFIRYRQQLLAKPLINFLVLRHRHDSDTWLWACIYSLFTCFSSPLKISRPTPAFICIHVWLCPFYFLLHSSLVFHLSPYSVLVLNLSFVFSLFSPSTHIMSLNLLSISNALFSFLPHPPKYQSFSSSHVFVPDLLVSFLNSLFPFFVSATNTWFKGRETDCKRLWLSHRRWTNWCNIGYWVSFVLPWLWRTLCTTFDCSDMIWLLSSNVGMSWQDQESLWYMMKDNNNNIKGYIHLSWICSYKTVGIFLLT